MGIDLKLIMPLIVIQAILMIIGLVDLFKTRKEEIKGGKKIVWAVVIVIIGYIGPIIYLTAGKKKR